MCLEWVKRKYKVTVVTGIPNYPMGKTFKGYGITKKRHEVWNGIEIYRIPLIPRGSGSLGMIANYLSFMVSGMLAGKMKNIKADLVFSFEVSPMTQVMTGISFAKKLHVPHYLYVQDLWPENVITVTGIRNPLIIKPIDKMVDYIYKNSDEIFATSPSFVEAICNRKVAVNREKVHYWPQYAEEFYKPIDKSIAKEAAAAYGIPNDDSFKIIFTGNVGTAQGIDILPQTAELLKNENIKFVIIGDGRYLEKLVSDIKSRQLEKMFIFVARQPAEKIPVLLSACDVAFISFADDELWKMTIPAKLQSYMACGMPIIAVADGETKRIIEEAKCGWVCKMGDSRGLKKTIHEVMKIDLQEMMKHSLCYYNNNYKKEKVISKIMDYLD
ncbi:glycosyltransferase WbuB [Firmicutes bacterium AM59-13]|nr:glycosyltransferase WbuB [Firmicutes bacterium AM59-13]